MKKIHWMAVASLLSLRLLTSCVDLDITPTSIVTAEDIYNEKGIKAYMAGMYNHLPMEDYHYDTNSDGTEIGGGYYVGNGLSVWTFWNSTGEMVNRNNTGMTYHRSGYWGGGFKVIRQANTLITNLPNYPE